MVWLLYNGLSSTGPDAMQRNMCRIRVGLRLLLIGGSTGVLKVFRSSLYREDYCFHAHDYDLFSVDDDWVLMVDFIFRRRNLTLVVPVYKVLPLAEAGKGSQATGLGQEERQKLDVSFAFCALSLDNLTSENVRKSRVE